MSPQACQGDLTPLMRSGLGDSLATCFAEMGSHSERQQLIVQESADPALAAAIANAVEILRANPDAHQGIYRLVEKPFLDAMDRF